MSSATRATRAAPRTAEFGARLRSLRRARGLRQQDLADGQYTAAYISMLESGRTRASMKALEHVARKLNVGVAELLGGAPQANESDAKLALARTYVAAEESDRALAVLDELRDETLTPRQQLGRLRLVGRAYLQLRRPKDAIDPLDRALRLAQQLEDGAEVAHVRNQLGTCCYYTFAYREAVQHYLAALDAVQRGDVHDRLLEFKVLSSLGNGHAALSEHDAAIGYYERALAMSADVVDQERVAGVHAGLAYAFTKQEDYEAAITHARVSLGLYEQLGAKRTLPEVMNNLAYLYGKVGNRTRADELLRQATDQARAAGNAYAVPQLILSRAELYATSDPTQAHTLGRQALREAEQAEHVEGIVSTRLFLASLEADVAKARAAFDDCVALAQLRVPARLAKVREAYADWEELHGDARRAAKLSREARKS